MSRSARPLALLGLAGLGLLLWLLVSGGSGYQLRVQLADADGLTTGSLVKVGGVSVGTVSSLTVTPHDRALAVVTLNSADAPVGRDAHLYVRAADLLGEKYLDLQVGDRGAPAPSGFTIPVAQTGEPVDIDQLLDVLDPSTRDRLAILIDETGAALFGRGHDVAQTLRGLPPTLVDVQQLLQEASSDTQTLKLLLDRANDVVSTVTTQRGALGSLVDTAATALRATAAKQADLQSTIADAPATLVQLQATLRQLDAAGDALRPAADGLVASAPALTQALRSLPAFTAAARPALSEVDRAAPFLRQLGEQATPLIRRLRPTAEDLQELAGDTDSLSATLDSSAANLLGTLQNWALAIQPRDAGSHQFRVSAIVSPQLISALLPFIEGTSAHDRHPGRVVNAAPASTAVAAASSAGSAPASPLAPSTKPGLPPAPLSGLVKNVLGVAAGTVAGTGHAVQGTANNLGGLLKYLLGR